MGTLRSRLSEQSALLGQDVSCALSTKRGPPVNAFVGRYGCQCGWYRGYDVYIIKKDNQEFGGIFQVQEEKIRQIVEDAQEHAVKHAGDLDV